MTSSKLFALSHSLPVLPLYASTPPQKGSAAISSTLLEPSSFLHSQYCFQSPAFLAISIAVALFPRQRTLSLVSRDTFVARYICTTNSGCFPFRSALSATICCLCTSTDSAYKDTLELDSEVESHISLPESKEHVPSPLTWLLSLCSAAFSRLPIRGRLPSVLPGLTIAILHRIPESSGLSR